jgi:iron complex outermembrane recepter protein
MKKVFLSILYAAVCFSAAAQKTLNGKVIDASNSSALAGATVSYTSKLGITTNNDGMFSIECGKANKITVSHIGYESKTVFIKNCDEVLTISLTPVAGTLGEVEVTATSNQNKSLLHQPVSITKLTPVELKRGLGLFLDDAIQTNVTGVIMNRRTVGGGQQFNIRGYGNGSRGTRGVSSNFDGQGYKLYLNGIPVTDAEGITTFDDLDFASVGNVEVAKGPAGTLYGLAIAGAVNLSTIKATPGKTSVAQDLMAGSYGLLRSTTQLMIGKEKSSVMVNYGHQKTDGYTWHNKSKKDFVNFIGDFTPNQKQTINIFAGYANSYDERFGELTLTQWQNDDYSGNPEYLKRNAHSNVITYRAGVGHTYNFSNKIANTTSVFGTGFSSNVSSAGGWTDKNTLNAGLRSVFNTKFTVANNTTLSGITGVEMQRQDASVIGYNLKADPNDPNPAVYTHGVSPYWVLNAVTSDLAYVSKTSSLFTEWTLALNKDLSFTAGIGASNMNISLDDRFNSATATKPSHFEKTYKAMVSPHVAVTKVFNKNFSAYASYSKGYKAPVASYFYIVVPSYGTAPNAVPSTARVNDGLGPESGNQFEIGTKGQLINNRLTYELAYFNTVFSNKMTAVSVVSPVSATTTLYTYMVNGGKQIHKGIEGMIKYEIIKSDKGFVTSLRPFANLTYSDFNYGDNFTIQKTVLASGLEDYSNKMVAGVPKYMANIGVDVNTKPGLYAGISYNYKDKFPVTSLNDVYTSSFNLLNAKLGIRRSLSNHFDVDAYIGGQNLTNTKYFLMVFVNQLPDAYIPAPRNANLFGGVNIKYNF